MNHYPVPGPGMTLAEFLLTQIEKDERNGHRFGRAADVPNAGSVDPTDPRLTLDDLCGVDGHPAARHDCHAADRALGIVRCPVHTDEWADRIIGGGDERMNADPRWRCGAATRPYEQHEFMLVCDRGHVVHLSEVETAEREDERRRDQARRREDQRAAWEMMARPMPDPSKPAQRTPLHGPLVVTGGGHYLAARFAVLLANIMIWLVNGAEKLLRRVSRDHELAVWVTGMAVLLVAAAGFSSAGLGVAWVGWCVAFMARGHYLSQQQRGPARGKHRDGS